MILSESLHPSMSRGGFAYTFKAPLSTAVADDFPQTTEGRWLSQLEVSRNELIAARQAIGWAAMSATTIRAIPENADDQAGPIASFAMSLDFDEVAGCWGSDRELDEADHTQLLWGIAGYDGGRGVLNPASAETKAKLQICDCPQCFNTRHYDFTHALSQRFELLEINPRFYNTLPDGRIQTIWGDVLPSLEDSIAEFRKLQQRCPPYAPEVDSPLTANGISKITIDETTGCWVVRTYYTKPLHMRGWQYDGYGRLTYRKHMLPRHVKLGGAQALAHRVVWKATGRRFIKDKVLNHLCSFRPCANPLHLEQVSKERNGRHGVRVQQAIEGLVQ